VVSGLRTENRRLRTVRTRLGDKRPCKSQGGAIDRTERSRAVYRLVRRGALNRGVQGGTTKGNGPWLVVALSNGS